MKNIKVMIPGSYDPLTYGHIDIITRASKLFDSVVVVVAENTSKNALFTIEERVSLLKEALKDYKNISVDWTNDLVARYAKQHDIQTIVRGVRNAYDYSYEVDIYSVNSLVNNNIETIFIPACEKYKVLCSSLIKELVHFGHDVSQFVPEVVLSSLLKKTNIWYYLRYMDISKENKDDIVSYLKKLVEETENYSKPQDLKLLKSFVKSSVKMYRRKDLYMYSLLKLMMSVQGKSNHLQEITKKVNENKRDNKLNNNKLSNDKNEFVVWVNFSPRGSEERFKFKSFIATESGISEDEIKKIEYFNKYSFIKLYSEKSFNAVIAHLNEKRYFNRVLKVSKKISK